MLLAVKPDVVSARSPNRFHYEHTLMALEVGHVMCEKPPAMTPEQAREMCDTARKLGKVLAYDFHHRFALDTQQLREQVTNGVLGEIYVTTARALRRCGVPAGASLPIKNCRVVGRRSTSAFICWMLRCMCWAFRR